MKDDKLRQEIALFRYGVIADFIHLPPATPGLYRKLAEKAEVEYRIPGSTRTRVAMDTIRDWLRQYSTGGFDALMPKPRNDAGRPRAMPDEVIETLLAIKEEHRNYTVRQVINEALSRGAASRDIPLPLSTVHRLLSNHGLMAKPPDDPSDNDRRRFQFLKAGDLWMSDVMYGPAVIIEGKRKHKTYLIAFLDDATRVIPFAAFTFSENNEAFMGVFKQTLMRRGIPKRLYVDNGSAYRCRHLELVCAKLGITLIHTRAYRPEAKGKQERWFRTVRIQLLPLLTLQDISSLDALNRRLWSYIEGEYHQNPHRGIGGQTPLDKWATVADEVRYVGPEIDLDDIFLCEAKRKVQKDRTVSLNGVVYEVDASLVGETVILRYDTSARRGHPLKVWFKGHFIQDAKPVDAYANCFVKRNRPSQTLQPSPKPTAQPTPPHIPPAPPEGLRLADMPDDEEPRDERENTGDDKEGR